MGEIAKKKKTCVRCKTVYEYESEEELSKYFYKMKDWYKNTCSSCEKKEHSEKYASGDYNYRKKDKKKYDKDVTFGFF